MLMGAISFELKVQFAHFLPGYPGPVPYLAQRKYDAKNVLCPLHLFTEDAIYITLDKISMFYFKHRVAKLRILILQ